MRYGRYGISYFIIRVSLGLTFIWIGIDILRSPDIWIKFIPDEAFLGLEKDSLLRFGGLFDLTIGLLLVFKIMPKLVGTIAAIHLATIFWLQGIDEVLVRNIGLLGSALALAIWPGYYRRKKSLIPIPFLNNKKRKKHESINEESD